MYFSIHRYEKGAYWPHLRESDFHYIGEGSGYGYNVNIPLNKTGMGDTEYMAIFHQVLLPLAYEVHFLSFSSQTDSFNLILSSQYSPDLVLVSAGFDSALGDPKASKLHFISWYFSWFIAENLLGWNGSNASLLRSPYFIDNGIGRWESRCRLRGLHDK